MELLVRCQAGGSVYPARATNVTRRVCAQVKNELKLAFEQWSDNPDVRLIRDTVTNQSKGHALVTVLSPEHAASLAKDMNEMVFMYSGGPRPLEASVAIPGGHQHTWHPHLHHSTEQYVL